jgi:purine nucleosidase
MHKLLDMRASSNKKKMLISIISLNSHTTRTNILNQKILDNLMAEKKITHCWLDCDPGHDDAFAILLATFGDTIKLIGLSTVSGNQTIEKTTQNALKALNLFGQVKHVELADSEFDRPLGLTDCVSHGGIQYPILMGSRRPLMRPSKICQEIHGESGLDTHVSLELPPMPTNTDKYVVNLNSQEIHFTTQMYTSIKRAGSPVTLLATGPLTNVALLLINHPDVSEHIEKIVIMGGAMGVGNTGPVAEFNIQVDPEAASYVFEFGLPIYMVPLEVTHEALVDAKILSAIGAIDSNLSKILIELLLFFKSTYLTVFYMNDPPLHDPCAVAFVIDPSLFEYRLMRVDVETSSALSYGQTVCDIFNMSSKTKNVHVCTKMNMERFWSMLLEAIRRCDLVSPANNKH